MVKIYVGNLSWGTDDQVLRCVFEMFGEVSSAEIARERRTGRSLGFGFVEMPNRDEAEMAIARVNGRELDGRVVRVNESRPKPKRNGGRRHGRARGLGRAAAGDGRRAEPCNLEEGK